MPLKLRRKAEQHHHHTRLARLASQLTVSMADEDYGDDDAFYFDDDDYLYVEDDYAIAVSLYLLDHSALRQTCALETGSSPALGKLHVAPNRPEQQCNNGREPGGM